MIDQWYQYQAHLLLGHSSQPLLSLPDERLLNAREKASNSNDSERPLPMHLPNEVGSQHFFFFYINGIFGWSYQNGPSDIKHSTESRKEVYLIAVLYEDRCREAFHEVCMTLLNRLYISRLLRISEHTSEESSQSIVARRATRRHSTYSLRRWHSVYFYTLPGHYTR